MKTVWLGIWDSIEGMMNDFEITPKDLEGVEILLANYDTPSYEGYAFVLFRKDGALYEVNGSHCSCYGLEFQWLPEETSIDALTHRLQESKYGMFNEPEFCAELQGVLKKLEEAE